MLLGNQIMHIILTVCDLCNLWDEVVLFLLFSPSIDKLYSTVENDKRIQN